MSRAPGFPPPSLERVAAARALVDEVDAAERAYETLIYSKRGSQKRLRDAANKRLRLALDALATVPAHELFAAYRPERNRDNVRGIYRLPEVARRELGLMSAGLHNALDEDVERFATWALTAPERFFRWQARAWFARKATR